MLAIVALEVPLATSVADRVDAEVRSQARGQADLAAATVADLLDTQDRRQRERVVNVVARTARGRVVVVNRRGRLLTDSEQAAPGTDFSARPEIRAALDGRNDQRERSSRSLGRSLLATSAPILRGGRPVGAVRVTQSVEAVDRAVQRAWLGLALIGLVVLGVGMLVGSLIAGQITRPLRRLDTAARRVADGDLGARVAIEGSSEQRSLGRTFNVMTQRLESLVGAQRRFVADASHQLRTPLTGLRLRMESVQGSRLEAHAADDVRAAMEEFDRLAQIIGELLELSRAGERENAGERLALGDLATRATARWQAAAASRDQRVTAAGDLAQAGVAWIARADADRIVDALIENALRYSPAGSDVEIAALPGCVEIRDRGPGLGENEAEEVFDRFRRGSAARDGVAGSGLGLAIARELARGWDGDVTLNPRPGGGMIAELRVPEDGLGKAFVKSAADGREAG